MLVKTPCLYCGKEIEVHYEPGSYCEPDGSEPPFCSEECWEAHLQNATDRPISDDPPLCRDAIDMALAFGEDPNDDLPF